MAYVTKISLNVYPTVACCQDSKIQDTGTRYKNSIGYDNSGKIMGPESTPSTTTCLPPVVGYRPWEDGPKSLDYKLIPLRGKGNLDRAPRPIPGTGITYG